MDTNLFIISIEFGTLTKYPSEIDNIKLKISQPILILLRTFKKVLGYKIYSNKLLYMSLTQGSCTSQFSTILIINNTFQS